MHSSYLLYIPLLLLAVWFLFLRPQQAAKKRAAEAAGYEVGDEIVTIGGLYGFIVSMDDQEVELDVAEGVVLRFARRAIAGKAPAPVVVDEQSEDDDALEDDDDNFSADTSSDHVAVIESAPDADESTGR